MFSYYGRKSKIIKYYPTPMYDTIIEPFAGSAAYSMQYFEKNVILIEKYDVLVKLWQWLIHEATEKEILALPSVVENDMIEKFDWLCQEEKWLMGFSLNRGSAQPKNKVKKFSDGWENVKKRIATDLKKIRHWQIRQGCYLEAENTKATWFIDPPYQFGGEWYRHKNIDYKQLKVFCLQRDGQVIVCENTKADWMDFSPLVKIQGSVNSNTTEAIWSNHKTNYDNVQVSLFEGM